ncbi:hypothetical protein TRIUR3_27538 [Triticum urartu]|uniref:Uncharacterized protein n=1 Tax=Triticum urartu TaxID=4572 RepID=M8A3P0_TRIUA|nr:hypothetical protein TRIUR3_27538 [Triticum urartu]
MEKVAMPWRFRLLASSPWWLGVLHPSSWSLGVMFRSWSGARSPRVSSLVVLHHVASPVCWSDWTEVDDFLAAKNLSTLHKIMPAKCRAAPDLPMPRPRCFFVMLHLRCDGSTGQRLTTSRSRRIRPHSTSLSTELLEDKQMFKLGGVDTSPTNKSSRNDLNQRRLFLEYIKNTGRTIQSGGPHPVHEDGGAPTPTGRALCLVGLLTLHRPQLQLHIFVLREKKLERRIHRVL